MISRMMYRAGTEIYIDPGSRQLSIYIGGQLKKTYPVAVGKSSTPTPTGDFKVINKVFNPGGVLGSRWMGLNVPDGNYGIHGTNNPSSIGKLISAGCIRMYNQNAEELFPQVTIGTPVRIAAVPGYNQQGVQPAKPTEWSVGPPLDHSIHIVRPGDTLWEISKQYRVSLDAILATNTLTNPDVIEVGQIIYIPN